MTRRIYVASSWRNHDQPSAVRRLEGEGHEVYNFRNPRPGDHGFAWSDVAVDWLDWTPKGYVKAVEHPLAESGFKSDMDAMAWADTFVLVLPCGRSAHLELGWAVGQGKRTAILLSDEGFEPELMYKMVDLIALDMSEVIDWLEEL